MNWESVHIVNFKCSIDTRLRSFYFKLFHKIIALNDFLFMIKRKDSPIATFVINKMTETMVHLFCDCEVVTPIWHGILQTIHLKYNPDFILNNFKKMFGVSSDKFRSYLFLSLKYYIYLCKFQKAKPSFDAFKLYIKRQKDIEYHLAKKRGKLSIHFKKWKFEL